MITIILGWATLELDKQPGTVLANSACFTAMSLWSFAFPASEVLLESWGVMALIVVRTGLAFATLMILWVWFDGLSCSAVDSWNNGGRGRFWHWCSSVFG